MEVAAAVVAVVAVVAAVMAVAAGRVTCAPQRSLSLPIIDRSASSEEERARRRRFASCFL